MTTFVKVPFAQSGDKTNPPVTDASGGVNWTQGYPTAYSKDPETDPSAKRIEREDFNGILFELSTAINELQTKGVGPFISATDNGGSAYSYSKGQSVVFNNITWMSMVDNNTTEPSVANSWVSVGGPIIGEPIPWPNVNLPEFPGAIFMKCNASPFTAAQYPIYAAINGSLKTPELRGEFIRGWDDGRGVDSGRALLSAQGDAIRNITGNVGVYADGLLTYASGAFSLGPSASNKNNPIAGTGTNAYAIFDASKVVPTASENRPRNVAFNYIVRVG